MTTSASVLRCIRKFKMKNGYPPSMEQLGECIGAKSKSTVSYWLKKLEAEGLIQRVPGQSRAIQVLEDDDWAR